MPARFSRARPASARCSASARSKILLLCAAACAGAPPGGGARGDETLAGRACRSVHLRFPAAPAVAFAHEARIEASDRGSYFMACGWGGGYFGVQERGDGGTLVLFSVWDRPAGDDPDAVPGDRRVAVRGAGPGVRAGRFGNEGTGAQTFLDDDWRPGDRCRFLVTAAPDGPGRTLYTGYYARVPGAGSAGPGRDWQMMAALSAPTPGGFRPLRGLYSFVEDFRRDGESPKFARRAAFADGWVLPAAASDWVPLTRAVFTADGNPARNVSADTVLDDAGAGFRLATGGDTPDRAGTLNATLTRPAPAADGPADLPTAAGIVPEVD